MKRFLCILLCLLLAAPAALADTYTPTKLFRQQFITGGNGLRGTVSITASGVAEWLEVILPFTASDLQVRIIGERQAGLSKFVTDDDDWQIKLWAKDAQGEQQGLTCIYGGPEAIYITSEMLDDAVLTLPVTGVNLPYQLTDGEFTQLLGAFDVLGLDAADNGGNTTAWSALTDLFSISDEEWEKSWTPVVSKYEGLVDMWLTGYASPTVLSSTSGSMTLRTTYEIPADDLKNEAKYIIGLMLVDAEMQNLVAPYLTAEQHSLYLNPAMQWFYNHCIDMMPLNGSILLEREMTAMGEVSSTHISLPLPQMPSELTGAVSDLMTEVFALPYEDIFAGLDRVAIRQTGDEIYVSLSCPARTISFIIDERAEDAQSLACKGFVRITPAVGIEEPPLSAAFEWSSSQRIWEDEDYKTHEDFTWSLALKPQVNVENAADLFLSTYVDFAPMSLSAEIGYIKKDKEASPVQLQIALQASLPDAEVGLKANLKIAERWAHDPLPTQDAEDLTAMTDERLEELRTIFVTNAILTMTNLNAVPAVTNAEQ